MHSKEIAKSVVKRTAIDIVTAGFDLIENPEDIVLKHYI